MVPGLPSWGAIINIAPGDSYTKIESAKAGDEVVIAPGTYAFRVYLSGQGSPTNLIIIRAQNPANPPVWDFGSTLVENAPGSYTAGDRGRGGWQFSGASNYRVSGLVFRNCRNAGKNCAGIRYYNTSTNLYLKDCVFVNNDNGLTGGTQDSDMTVEFCEFATNGNLTASAATHNIYIYGGAFTMRYCYLHDSAQSQNFHMRCRNSTLEYNWFARAKNYEGDLMTNDDFSGAGPFSQSMTLRGNVFVQSASPGNSGQVVAVYNDTPLTNLTLAVRLLYNTFVGNGGHAALVHLSNADGTRMNAEESNNIIFGTTVPVLIEDGTSANASGINNWMQTNANAGPFTGSIRTAVPGFRNPAAQDYTLASGSACIGAANAAVYGLPGKEYYRNEATNRMWRPRAAGRDLGAFESTTAFTAVGAYDIAPLPRLATAKSGTDLVVSWPLFASDFQLQSSTAVSAAVWTDASWSLVTNANGISTSISAPGGPRFYRLRK